jgi:hypothetical protein
VRETGGTRYWLIIITVPQCLTCITGGCSLREHAGVFGVSCDLSTSLLLSNMSRLENVNNVNGDLIERERQALARGPHFP